jgi:cell division protein FtsI (penicillin-binding protein 3)
VSAPVFKRIAEAAVTYLGIGPTLNAPPPVLVARHDTVTASEAAVQPAAVRTTAPAMFELARSGVMPDLRGLSAREAIRVLSQIGMTARMSGDGFVIAQSPDPGASLVRGDLCALRLNRRVPPLAAGGEPQ